MTTIYGIPNCDTIKKCRKWLTENNVEYTFHDYRKDGVEQKLLQTFIAKFGWEKLINKRGLTWRQLIPEQKEGMDEQSAIATMLQSPAIIKRPVLQLDSGELYLGFKPQEYQKIDFS